MVLGVCSLDVIDPDGKVGLKVLLESQTSVLDSLAASEQIIIVEKDSLVFNIQDV